MNLNIFKRIAELEKAKDFADETKMDLNYKLFKLTELIEQLQKTINNNTVSKKTADEKRARARAYAKRYYAKKKAALAYLKSAA
jgi:hypothetical protein